MRSYISRTATFAWSPSNIPNAEPLIVTGTLSGALDESFSNDSLLEIWKPNYGAGEVVQPIAKLVAGARFNRLAWGYVCEKYPMGVIAAGLENGELNLWDAKKMIDGVTDGSASILRNNQHSGPVKGLHFNPKQPNLLASGGVNGEIFIWDLSNPGKPYSPGARSSKLDEITALSWNGEVPHILATSSSSGYTVVWDLRNKKELTALAYGGGAGTAGGNANGMAPGGPLASGARRGMGALCWHPEQPTRLATASDDDASPVVMLWDLRNSRAPEKVLSGHNGGILSLSWCKQDADLLLSCGKDNRTICWNPQTGQNVGELPASQNWSYDVQWCPKNPNLVAVASFDGRININSVQDTNQQETPIDTSAAPTDVNDVFNSLPAQSEANNRGISLTQPPKWLKKPISATFAFGGQLVSTSNLPGEKGHTQSAVVHLRDVVTEPSIASRAKRLQDAIDSQGLASFCAERSSDPSTRPDDVANWKALQTLFQADNRDELVTLLGFSKEEVAAKIASSIGAFKQTSAVTAPGLSAPGTPGLNGTSEAALVNEDIASTANAVIPGLDGDIGADKTPPATAGLADVSAPASDIAEPPTAFDSEPNPFDAQQSSGGGDAADLFNSLGSAPAKSAVPDHLFAAPATGPTASVAATAGSPRPSSIASESLRANNFRIYPENESEFDKLVTRALVLGDFQSAVSLCLSTDRHADAILLAVRGGPELLARTQKAYFERKTASLPYLRLFQSIVSDDLSDIVQNADLTEWQEIFVVVCTFAKRNEDFVNLAEQLGQRLEFQYTQAQNSNSAKTFRKNAVLCYLAAGKLEKVASMWIDEMKEEEKALQHGQVNGTTTNAESTSLYSAHAEALQSFMEKIIVFQSAVNYVDVDIAQVASSEEMAAAKTYKLAPLYDRILEYVDLLADQGLVAPALKYINQTPLDYHVGTENISGLARERLRLADQAKTGGQGAAAVTAAANSSASVFVAAAAGAPVSTNAYAPAAVNNSAASYDPYGQSANNAYQSYGVSNAYDPYGQASANPASSAYAPPTQANVPPALQQQPIQSQSAYAPAQPLVAAPPPPVIGVSDVQSNFAPPAGSYGQQSTLAAAPPPPPPKKPDGGWNDIPSNLAPKRTTSAMSNRSSAQPITSPFPNAPVYNNASSTPQMQPSYGGAQQGAGAGSVPPPPRGIQPPRGMMSPPPGGAGGPYGRPGSGLGAPFAPQQQGMRPPPPQNAGPPPRGSTPGGVRPGPGGAQPPYQQSQQQPQQAPSGPYAPGPGQVSVPPPPGPLGPGQQSGFGGPMGQQPPSQFGGAPQHQQGPPQPGHGPGSGFARPPMPAIPPSGPPSNVPLRSTTPGAGAGAPPNRSATPAKPATKYPPGDRSHIADNAKPILQTLSKELARFKSITPPAQKRMADDVDKRVNLLLDLLNCGTLDARTVQSLIGICQAIDARNQQAALSQYVQLASSSSGDVATALFGLKQVISKLNQ